MICLEKLSANPEVTLPHSRINLEIVDPQESRREFNEVTVRSKATRMARV
jgi:hypothetical protein